MGISPLKIIKVLKVSIIFQIEEMEYKWEIYNKKIFETAWELQRILIKTLKYQTNLKFSVKIRQPIKLPLI